MGGGALPEEAPRASAERIRRFVDAHRSTRGRYLHEVVPLMQRDDPDESRIVLREVPLDDVLRAILRVRANIVANRPPPTSYAVEIVDDVAALVAQLDSASDQRLGIWYVSLPSGLVYVVFELLEDHRIAGCVKSADA